MAKGPVHSGRHVSVPVRHFYTAFVRVASETTYLPFDALAQVSGMAHKESCPHVKYAAIATQVSAILIPASGLNENEGQETRVASVPVSWCGQ